MESDEQCITKHEDMKKKINNTTIRLSGTEDVCSLDKVA
jgi:hypothetical protein